MDKKRDWTWLPRAMPGVAALMRDKRRELGHEHVNLCWRRGVIEGHSGWFYAREGTLAVGAPFIDDELQLMRQAQAQLGGALLMLRTKEAGSGA